jgi:predicted TIM-barrel fold metal-dependent hydrolase
MSKRAPGFREDDSWFSDEQLTKVAPAETEPFQSPVPTRMVSNGEYMPFPQTEKQKHVEFRTKELADMASKKLGISRRKFLESTGGMAAAFLAMNEVFGRIFNVSPIEMFEPAAYAANGAPPDLFVFDDQTHLVRSRQRNDNPNSLRAIAQGPGPASTAGGFLRNPFNPLGQLDELGSPWTPWNPLLDQIPNVGDEFNLVKYIQRFYLESQVTVAILSNANIANVPVGPGVPSRPPRNIQESLDNEILTGDQTAGVRDFVNQIAGSTRMLAHGQLYPGIGNLDYMQQQIDTFHPDSWKGYNIARAAKVDFDPNSDMRRWRMDDEAVAYPTYELIAKNRKELVKHPGFFNICVHKGLSTNAGPEPELGHPMDIPKAAMDWPEFNFIYYHSCIRPGFFCFNALQDVESGRLRNAANEVGADVAEGVPDILWTTEFAVLSAPFRNVYAELGTTFASTVVTFPTAWSHIIGQLLKFLGDDRIVWGSDSLWYGSPQWQIEAFWRFQIPKEIRKKWGYPALTETSKRKILGVNSARLYRVSRHVRSSPSAGYRPVPADFESQIPDSLKTLLDFPGTPGYLTDNFSKMRKQYVEMGGGRSNTRHGWIRTKV